MSADEAAPKKRRTSKAPSLKPEKPCLSLTYGSEDGKSVQIGVDEAGRGPMLGRVYAAAVLLPSRDQAPQFHFEWLKDSKKFSSEKKLAEVASHIKEHCVWSVAYSTEQMIDQINIRQATHHAMLVAIKDVICKKQPSQATDVLVLVDGNDFRPITMTLAGEFCAIAHVTVEGGDDKYAAIAAASILAKHARDAYIFALVADEPLLDQRYGLAGNKGYGSKNHMDGIRQYGISPYHRKTFGLCKQYAHPNVLTAADSVKANDDVL